MKTHHLIFLTTALFVVLFYGQSLGLNLGILGIVVSVLTYFHTPERNRTRSFLILFVTSIFSSFAFAWYGDFVSFLAVFTSLFLLSFKSKNRRLKSLFVIPVFALNFLTFIYRVFLLDKWLPQRKMAGFLQRLIAVAIIPGVLIAVFFAVYTHGSSHFASLFSDFQWDINFWEIFGLSILGFFIFFNFWNYTVERFFYKQNHWLHNDFLNEDKTEKATYSFLNLDSERLSGVVSLLGLNVLLLFFIFTFNYEQFVEFPKSAGQLSDETHERVVAVILSIVMAVLVIMFYFKGTFNFDKKAGILKLLAKIWVFLNTVLVFSAFAKNSEYVMNLGLTYKRLGVYAFLILSIIGLIFTFIKIQKQKTNAYLFNQMAWYFYGTVLVCSYINWGAVITCQNLQRENFDIEYLLLNVEFNDKELLEYAKQSNNMKQNLYIHSHRDKNVKSHQGLPFLSKNLYYETINLSEAK